MLHRRQRPRHRRIARRARARRRRRRRRRDLRRRPLEQRPGAPRRARGRPPLRRRGDRPAACSSASARRPSLRPTFRPRRWRRWSTGRWRWPREAPEDPYAGLAPPSCCMRGDSADLDADDRQRARSRRRCAPGRSQPRRRALGGRRASPIRAAARPAPRRRPSPSRPRPGFAGAYRATGHSCSASVIAGEGAGMQRDYAWHSARHLDDLETPRRSAGCAGERAVARLNPARPKPGKMPVLFDPRVAAIAARPFRRRDQRRRRSPARRASCRTSSGSRIFAHGRDASSTIRCARAGCARARSTARACRSRGMDLVADGVLTTWIADSASARQLGIQPTGHAVRGVGGAPGAGRAISTSPPGSRSREELLAAFPEAHPRHRADRPGRQRRHRRLQPRRGRLPDPRRRDRRAGRRDHHRLQPHRDVRDAGAGERPRVPPRNRRADVAGAGNDGRRRPRPSLLDRRDSEPHDLDLRAAVHHDLEAGRLGARRGFLVDRRRAASTPPWRRPRSPGRPLRRRPRAGGRCRRCRSARRSGRARARQIRRGHARR